MRVLIRLMAPASIIERMDLGYASNLMRVRVGLTAPAKQNFQFPGLS